MTENPLHISQQTQVGGVWYEIDAEDRISNFNENWSQFAEENDSPELAKHQIVGQPLWRFISDDATRALYKQIVSRVRNGQSARFRLRCDGPECRRLLEMTICGDANGTVRFETLPLKIEKREPVALFSRNAIRSDDMVRVCAWCDRIHVGPEPVAWIEVEEAVERLQLFEQALVPHLTHGICETCFVVMTETLEKLD